MPHNNIKSTKISLLLNKLNLDFDYSKIQGVNALYIPFKYFYKKEFANVLKLLNSKFDIYMYMPTIIKSNYCNLFYNTLEDTISKYDIKGFVISNICNIKILNALFTNTEKKLPIIANYTFNIYNTHTIKELKELEFHVIQYHLNLTEL